MNIDAKAALWLILGLLTPFAAVCAAEWWKRRKRSMAGTRKGGN